MLDVTGATSSLKLGSVSKQCMFALSALRAGCVVRHAVRGCMQVLNGLVSVCAGKS